MSSHLMLGQLRTDMALHHVSAMGEVSRDDRDWFLANPGRSFRLRPIAEAELAVEGRRRPAAGSGLAGYTVVRQFKPGFRVRACFKAFPFHRPENFSDAACAMLFSEMKKNARTRAALFGRSLRWEAGDARHPSPHIRLADHAGTARICRARMVDIPGTR